MNITIVVVTHQMEVIKQICNKVAFLKDGRVLSVGKPEELFVAPNQEIQKFVGDDIEILPQTGKNIKLFFTNNNSKSHTITQLARTLDINFDICQGKLENFRGSMMGSLITVSYTHLNAFFIKSRFITYNKNRKCKNSI